jgi:hypothetical protein
MKILKLSIGDRNEIINEYKIINITLSKVYEYGQKSNKLTPLEQTKYINYDELLKIRKILYNEWEEEYENTPLNNLKIRN